MLQVTLTCDLNAYQEATLIKLCLFELFIFYLQEASGFKTLDFISWKCCPFSPPPHYPPSPLTKALGWIGSVISKCLHKNFQRFMPFPPKKDDMIADCWSELNKSWDLTCVLEEDFLIESWVVLPPLCNFFFSKGKETFDWWNGKRLMFKEQWEKSNWSLQPYNRRILRSGGALEYLN